MLLTYRQLSFSTIIIYYSVMGNKELIGFAVIAVIAVLACTFIVDSHHDGDDTERIGIIGAMDDEIAALRDAMDIEYTETLFDMTFNVGTLKGKDIALVKCGMGKVNAGICAEIMITHFNAKSIINTGVSGSMDNDLDILDFVVSTDAVQHDFDVSPIGFEKGEIPYTGKYSFEADPELATKAALAVSQFIMGSKVMQGRICTGDQFINSDEQKDTILSNFGGLCCDMESGAIAQVCYLSDVPFVIIRAISDKADHSASMDYDEFEPIAAERSASAVMYMLGIL
ncbi:MAG: 5'-methylthioadenosine/adenosylhomocysteine nucleosidase [Candidatus Methanomethylophilaceae archaeon]|nr:5'-methylthioadenosine/adenosylhomocysteine nucleosidase [Candidatus Methanomethylophilaceae archaeon]